jgi:hypothetical protein
MQAIRGRHAAGAANAAAAGRLASASAERASTRLCMLGGLQSCAPLFCYTIFCDTNTTNRRKSIFLQRNHSTLGAYWLKSLSFEVQIELSNVFDPGTNENSDRTPLRKGYVLPLYKTGLCKMKVQSFKI